MIAVCVYVVTVTVADVIISMVCQVNVAIIDIITAIHCRRMIVNAFTTIRV